MTGAALTTAAALGAAVSLETAFGSFEAVCGGEDGGAPALAKAFVAAGFAAEERVADYAYGERDGGRLAAGYHITQGSWGCFVRAETAPVADLCGRLAQRLPAQVERIGGTTCFADLGAGAHVLAHDICPDRPERLCLWLKAVRRGE